MEFGACQAAEPAATGHDYAWLGFLMLILGNGSSYPARPVIQGDFHAN